MTLDEIARRAYELKPGNDYSKLSHNQRQEIKSLVDRIIAVTAVNDKFVVALRGKREWIAACGDDGTNIATTTVIDRAKVFEGDEQAAFWENNEHITRFEVCKLPTFHKVRST